MKISSSSPPNLRFFPKLSDTSETVEIFNPRVLLIHPDYSSETDAFDAMLISRFSLFAVYSYTFDEHLPITVTACRIGWHS
jgi:hypothetical protein